MYYTYISRKQIGVIFSNWKRGNLNLAEEQINWLYNTCAEVKGYNNNHDFDAVLQRVKAGIDHIFNGDLEEAQKSIEGAYKFYNICFKD